MNVVEIKYEKSCFTQFRKDEYGQAEEDNIIGRAR